MAGNLGHLLERSRWRILLPAFGMVGKALMVVEPLSTSAASRESRCWSRKGLDMRTLFTTLAFIIILMAVIPAVKRSLYPRRTPAKRDRGMD